MDQEEEHTGPHLFGAQKDNANVYARIVVFTLFLDNHSLAGYKVSGISPSVVVNWVSEVVGKPLSVHDGLNEESKHGEHGESPILELLHFKLGKGLEIIGKAQGVEASAWVKWVNHLAKWSSGNTVALDGSHQDDLCSPDSQGALRVDQAWVSQVVESALAEDLGSGLELHRLTELDAIAGQKLGEDTQESSEHCPPRVDHLKLAVLGESPTTLSGPYHGLPDETTLLAFFLMETLPLPVIFEAVGVICTAFSTKDGEERAIVDATMAKE
ncbi:hypothetical protein RJ640_009727 [Escallonia rubra]|uniref:Uncharacterized protein n=1 Tax=Escallonia rubra TaxID=112253 RepID=A0AA88QR45_9ASTE|nr:hypothetical protein RJ640_009727 [Escallonia rubra]